MTISEHATHFVGKQIVDYSPVEGVLSPVQHAYRIATDPIFGVSWDEQFSTFLRDPHAAEVTAIVVGSWDGVGDGVSSSSVVDALLSAAYDLSSLTSIFLGDITFDECDISLIQQSDLSPLFVIYPQLQHLRVRGSRNLYLGALYHDQLRALTIESGGLDQSIVYDIQQSYLPSLEHLELWIGDERYGANVTLHDLAPFLTNDNYPFLTYLGLCNCACVDELAELVAFSPILMHLRTLDFSLGIFTARGAAALLEAPGLDVLEKLDVHYHYCPDDVMERLQALPFSVDVSGQQKRGVDNEYERFVAVSV